VLPFTDFKNPWGLAADTTGSLYVTESYDPGGRVLKLPAGSGTQTELPFTGLTLPKGVAVDTAGNVYVAGGWARTYAVVKLAAGSRTQTELPFTGLNGLVGVAVDTAGNVYVADNGAIQAVASDANSGWLNNSACAFASMSTSTTSMGAFSARPSVSLIERTALPGAPTIVLANRKASTLASSVTNDTRPIASASDANHRQAHAAENHGRTRVDS
jgi:DNA-binding beta-propeller fold protein YncE